MGDYISRQAAIDAIHKGGLTEYCEIVDIREIEALPAADVVPVVHSRWIKYTGMGKVQWMCEKCSAEEKNPKVAKYYYHCGAKMDG